MKGKGKGPVGGCFNCGGPHYAANCPKNETTENIRSLCCLKRSEIVLKNRFGAFQEEEEDDAGAKTEEKTAEILGTKTEEKTTKRLDTKTEEKTAERLGTKTKIERPNGLCRHKTAERLVAGGKATNHTCIGNVNSSNRGIKVEPLTQAQFGNPIKIEESGKVGGEGPKGNKNMFHQEGEVLYAEKEQKRKLVSVDRRGPDSSGSEVRCDTKNEKEEMFYQEDEDPYAEKERKQKEWAQKMKEERNLQKVENRKTLIRNRSSLDRPGSQVKNKKKNKRLWKKLSWEIEEKEQKDEGKDEVKPGLNILGTVIPEGVNMVGKASEEWEEIEMAVDSGATETVVGEDMLLGVQLKEGKHVEKGCNTRSPVVR